MDDRIDSVDANMALNELCRLTRRYCQKPQLSPFPGAERLLKEEIVQQAARKR
jgi:hypothetical protein